MELIRSPYAPAVVAGLAGRTGRVCVRQLSHDGGAIAWRCKRRPRNSHCSLAPRILHIQLGLQAMCPDVPIMFQVCMRQSSHEVEEKVSVPRSCFWHRHCRRASRRPGTHQLLRHGR